MKATNHFCHYHQPFLSTLPNFLSKINEDDDALNELMDIFDDYIFRGNRKINNALREFIG